MADPPGNVLPRLNSCSEKRGSKLGGYADVFFQLFDWNRRLNGKRLLAQKPLPAERPPKRGKRTKKDEKLSMPKLLLIANENRGGFPKTFHCKTEEVLDKDKTPEKKNRRTPNVVAKLMGLETMPSPEACKQRKEEAQESQTHHAAMPSAAQFNDRNLNFRTSAKSHSVGQAIPAENLSIVSQSSTAVDPKTALNITAGKPPKALVCHKSDDPKITFLCKLPSLSPRKTESALRSILSPSKAHNKLLSPIKSPLATKRGARLLEAAAKMLEPKMQPSSRMRGLGISSQVAARSLLGNVASIDEKKPGNQGPQSKKKPLLPVDAKKQQQNVPLRVYSDQSKPTGKPKPDKKPSSMDTNVACKSEAPLTVTRGSPMPLNQKGSRSGTAMEESVSIEGPSARQPRFMRSKSKREEPERGKPVEGHHRDLRNGKEEKRKPESTRQKQTVNRLSQPRSGTKKRDSAIGSMEATNEIENKDPNVRALCNGGHDRNSVSGDSIGANRNSSSILSYGKLFSSRKSVTNHESARNNEKKGDSSVIKSILRRKGPSRDSLTKSHLNSADTDRSQSSSACKIDESGSTLSDMQSSNNCSSSSLACIAEKSIDDNCPEVESALANSLSMKVSETSMKSIQSNGAILEPSIESGDANSLFNKCNILVEPGVSVRRVSNQSESSIAGELRDSALSPYAHLELRNRRRKQAVSYSGKSTAAILQELLMALSSNRAKTVLNDSMQHMADGIGSESSSMFTLYPQFGEDCEDSANSVGAVYDDLKKTQLLSARQISLSDEWRQPSPISTLEFPYSDDSSTFSDGTEHVHGNNSLSSVCSSGHHQIVSKRHHHAYLSAELSGCKQSYECEEQYVKDVVKTANLSPVNIYAVKLGLPCTILNKVAFNELEDRFYQQWNWGMMPDENLLAKCRSETEMYFTKSLYAEAGIQNRKLVFECVHESLNMQLGINAHYARQSPFQSISAISEMHLSQSVCKQMEMWRSMACSMNIDDVVEQEMNAGIGKWADFIDEVSDFAVETEFCIVQKLIDELVLDLSRKLFTLPGSLQEIIR